jgi:hypothetical protein
MGFLRRLLGGGSDDAVGDGDDARGEVDGVDPQVASEATFDAQGDRHRVTVWLRVYDASFENEREQQRVFVLENRVMRALDEASVGEHDTNSIEPGYFAMRLVGDDADAIVAVVRPLLRDVPAGSYLAVRHGPAGSAEERVDLGTTD